MKKLTKIALSLLLFIFLVASSPTKAILEVFPLTVSNVSGVPYIVRIYHDYGGKALYRYSIPSGLKVQTYLPAGSYLIVIINSAYLTTVAECHIVLPTDDVGGGQVLYIQTPFF